jgi:hypothetical protein
VKNRKDNVRTKITMPVASVVLSFFESNYEKAIMQNCR